MAYKSDVYLSQDLCEKEFISLFLAVLPNYLEVMSENEVTVTIEAYVQHTLCMASTSPKGKDHSG